MQYSSYPTIYLFQKQSLHLQLPGSAFYKRRFHIMVSYKSNPLSTQEYKPYTRQYECLKLKCINNKKILAIKTLSYLPKNY